jgi:predicted ATPase/class 3 adenylate cyclase
MSDSTGPLVSHHQEINNIETTIVALEAQRNALGDLVVDTALDLLREKLATLMQPDQASDERKRVTVLFADVSGYTALSENLDPEDVANIMNRLFEAVTVEIHRYGGTVDKYSGDAVMALFGAPQALENHEEMAVRASIAMQRVIGEFSEALEKERGFRVAMRIGLNTGPVLAGLVGGLKTRSYTVMGDTVNLASRLEHAAPVGRILISATTAQPVQAVFDLEPPQQISVKGKSEPITVYLVNGERAERGRVRGLAGLYAPMVGREAEFLDLLDTYRDVVRNRSWQATAVVGDAGIGKSRIRREFVAWVAGTFPNTRIVTGTCFTHTRTTPYAFIAEQIRSLFSLNRNVQVETAVTQISNELHNLQPKLDDTEFQYQLGSLASVLGFTIPKDPLRGLDPEQRRDRTFLSLERIYLAAASQAPMLLIIDDLHWADMLSMAFLERLLQMVSRDVLKKRGAMILILSRPAEDLTSTLAKVQTELHDAHQVIELTALDNFQSGQLITELLDQELPPELTQLISQQAQGNPFYVEEIIRSFIEDGTLHQDDTNNQWQVTRAIADVEVPGSVQDIIAARLDRLPPGNKRITQHAAIIGRTFWQELLSHITDSDTVEPTLSLLEMRQLADRLSQSQIAEDWEWMFRHILIQEVAYTTVPKTTRRQVHKQVAERLEYELDEQTSFLLPLIGFHFEQGNVPDKAIYYLTKAGEQAAAQFANEAAVGYFNRALNILNNLAEKKSLTAEEQMQQYKLLLGRAEVYHLTGQREPQAADLTQLQILANASGSDQHQAEVALKHAAYYQAISDFPTAVTYAKTAVTHAQQAEDMRQKVEGLNAWASGLISQSEFDEAEALLQQAQQLAAQQNDLLNESISLLRLGIISYFRGVNSSARDYYEASLASARQLKNLPRQAASLINLVGVYYGLGDINYAKICGEEALAIVKTVGDRANETIILNNLGAIYHAVGDLETAHNYHLEALHLSQSLKNRVSEALSANNLGSVLCDQALYSDAIVYAEKALSTNKSIGNRVGQGYNLTIRAKAQQELNHFKDAIKDHHKAIEIRREIGQEAGTIDNLSELANIALAQNNLSLAREYVEQILAWIDKNGLDGIEHPIRVYLACIDTMESLGKHEEGVVLLKLAKDLLKEKANRIGDQETREAFLKNIAAHREITQRSIKKQGTH